MASSEFARRRISHLQSTVSVWYLYSSSELQQDGDTGGTVASKQPSNRYGVEWTNYYTPVEHLAVNFDLANSKALFTAVDDDDAVPDNPGGRRVPEGGWLSDFFGCHTAQLRRLFGEFAPPLFWVLVI